MKKLSIIIIIASCLIFAPARFADEGMWTFDNPPLKQWKEKYGFEPSREWLDHARLSTARLSEGAIQKLPSRYLYVDESEGARAVGAHGAGVVEALSKLYGADKLVAEIKGR